MQSAVIASSARVSSRYRWTVCALLFFATVINYMDRQILGLLAPILQKDIGWTQVEYGRIVIAFLPQPVFLDPWYHLKACCCSSEARPRSSGLSPL